MCTLACNFPASKLHNTPSCRTRSHSVLKNVLLVKDIVSHTITQLSRSCARSQPPRCSHYYHLATKLYFSECSENKFGVMGVLGTLWHGSKIIKGGFHKELLLLTYRTGLKFFISKDYSWVLCEINTKSIKHNIRQSCQLSESSLKINQSFHCSEEPI